MTIIIDTPQLAAGRFIAGDIMHKFCFCLGIAVLILGFAPQGNAMASKRTENTVTLQGVIRVVGNEPFTHVVLTVTDGASGKTGAATGYVIIGPLARELRMRYQMREVTLKGVICKSGAPGFAKCLEPSIIVENDSGQ